MKEVFGSGFYKDILNKINSNIYITDVETDEIVFINDYMKRTFNIKGKVVKGLCWKMLQRGMESRCSFCPIEYMRQAGIASYTWKENNTVTGRMYYNYDILQEWKGKLYHIQNSIDITDSVRLSLEASTDELTGILNRSAGKKHLDDLLQKTSDDSLLTVALCDLNGLKWVNDTYGHLEGDKFIMLVAHAMRDFLTKPDFVFRLSGDEFVMAFSNKNIYDAEAIIQKMLKRLRDERNRENIAYEVSFSYGFASCYGREKLTVSDILSIADVQMYIQKRDYHISVNQNNALKTEQAIRASFDSISRKLFNIIAEYIDDYVFMIDLKTGAGLYSPKMVGDFTLPGQFLQNANAFWSKIIHPDDVMSFLRSNQEVTDGRTHKHTIVYRAKDRNGQWVHLACQGSILKDDSGRPRLFAGVIRNLDKQSYHYVDTFETKNASVGNTINSVLYGEDFTNQKEDVHRVLKNKLDQQPFYFMPKFFKYKSSDKKNSLIKHIQQNIPGGILAVYDKDEYPMIYFNHTVLEFTGYTRSGLENTCAGYWERIIYPDDRKMVRDEISKQLKTSSIYDVRYRVIGSDKKLIWIYERGKHMFDEDGQSIFLSFLFEISRDISIEQELRFITNNTTDGIFKAMISKGFPVLYANEGYYKIHGYTKEQYQQELGNLAEKVVYEKDFDRVSHIIYDVIQKKKRHVVLEYRIKKRNSGIAWVHVDSSLIYLDDKTIILVGIVIDITMRRNLEEQLRHKEQLFIIAKKYSRISIWEYDIRKKRIIQDEHAVTFKFFGNIIENVPECFIEQKFIHPNYADVTRALYKQLEDGKKEASAIMKIQVPMGSQNYVWKRVTYTIISNSEAESSWAIGISEDVTEQKEAEIKVFREETMRDMLTRDVIDIVCSFRLNLEKNQIEEFRIRGEKYISEDSENNYELISRYIYNSMVNENDKKRFEKRCSYAEIQKCAATKTGINKFDFRQKTDDGSIIWASLTMKILTSPVNGETILFGYVKNIDSQKKRELVLQRKAETDKLTGFYRENTIKLLIKGILNESTKGNQNMAMLLMDIDNFCWINKYHAEVSNEDILLKISEQLKMRLPNSCIVGHVNKDMFLLFYYDMKSAQDIYLSAKTIRRALSRSYIFDNIKLDLSLSAGIAFTPQTHQISYEKLYQNALHALVQAKRGGKDRLVSYLDSEDKSLNTLAVRFAKDFAAHNILELFEKCCIEAEKGADIYEIYPTFFEQLNRFCQAETISFFSANKDGDLELTFKWSVHDFVNLKGKTRKNVDQLKKLFLMVYPKNSLYIKDIKSGLARQLRDYYGQNKAEVYPVLLAGNYESFRLVNCLVLEKIQAKISEGLMEMLQTACQFVHHIQKVYLLRQNYEKILYRDKKTGLLNYEQYQRYLERANEDVFSTFGMIEVRIVNLKKYNRQYGNHQGDELLLFISSILSTTFGSENCYRINGAKFFVLCADMAYDIFLQKYMELERQFNNSYPEWIVCSKVWEQNAISLEKIQVQLDEKIQIALAKKREKVNLVNNQSVQEVLKNLQMNIAENRFCIYLQPKANIRENIVHGAEALIRYCTPEKGVIPPGRFLPSIEQAGLIRHIDLFVLKEVCRTLRNWLLEGKEVFTISLNYSRKTILEPDILNETNRIVESYNIPKNLIEIEITETVASTDSVGLQDIVNDFIKSGYKIALDDFGADYSNIYVLYSLNINTLKLDRRIVSDIYHDDRARLVVENVIDICRKLNIECVAEGVETAEQLEVLKNISCDMIQGYYINKPIPVADFQKEYIDI